MGNVEGVKGISRECRWSRIEFNITSKKEQKEGKNNSITFCFIGGKVVNR